VARTVELSGLSVVGAGSFNPAIFHPWWFAEKELIAQNAIEAALDKEFVAVRELTSFTADWLAVQVTLDQAQFSTVEQGREFDLRDLTVAVFDLLPETPVNAVGLNADVHFRVADEEEWHALGDIFLPKDFWQPFFEEDTWKQRGEGLKVGLRSLTVEAHRADIPAFVRTEVAPSVRLTPHGVYIGVNAHFQLTQDEDRGNGYKTARTLEDYWEAIRELETQLIGAILEAA
jgi:hypothetical protein